MSKRPNLESWGFQSGGPSPPPPSQSHTQLSPTHFPAHSLLKGAGIRAGGTLLTGGPVGARLDADAAAALALAPAAAQQPVTGHAGVGARGAVTVVAGPVGVTQAVPTAALAVAWKNTAHGGRAVGEGPTPHQWLNLLPSFLSQPPPHTAAH